MSRILFVFEGARTEKQIADSFSKCFPDKRLIVHCAYCTTIYNLYNKINRDKDLDTFSLLKELPNNKAVLKPFKRKDFAEIYLFFDYDGHTSSADDEKMKAILELFDEETEFGKIFINYPMVESLKHISDNIDDFKELKVEAKKNINYKRIARAECQVRFRDFNLYTKDIWIFLIKEHLKKMNFINNGDYSLPTETHNQNNIFANQIKKHIKIDSTIAVLSSFPIFIFDYYGRDLIS